MKIEYLRKWLNKKITFYEKLLMNFQTNNLILVNNPWHQNIINLKYENFSLI